MKNSKYIEVSVSDRLPDKEGTYICIFSSGEAMSIPYWKEYSFALEFTDCSGITHWLEEVLDYEEEMKEVLLQFVGCHTCGHAIPDWLNDKAEELLTKLKTES